jgi:hypothetical protein
LGNLAGCSPASRSWLNPYDPGTPAKLVYETTQTGADVQIVSTTCAPGLNPANSTAFLSGPGDTPQYLDSVELSYAFLAGLGNISIDHISLGVKVVAVTGAPSGLISVWKPDTWPALNTQCISNLPAFTTSAPLAWSLNSYAEVIVGGAVPNIFNGVPRFVLQANGPGGVTGGAITISNVFRIRVYYKLKA